MPSFITPLFALVLSIFITVAASASELSEQVLEEINLARTQPQAYAQLLAEVSRPGRDTAEAVRFLQKVRPLPPLASSTGLSQASLLHVSTQGPAGGTGHGFGWNTPFSRMQKYGQWLGNAGENVFYGRRSARGIVCALIVDSGVSSRGHRKNIFSSGFGVAGVASGYHARFGSMCVIDFAAQYIDRTSRTAGL